MKLVYGISSWTNPSRASARHIDDGFGKPLCGSKRKVLSWEREEGKPTCQRCIAIYKKFKVHTGKQKSAFNKRVRHMDLRSRR